MKKEIIRTLILTSVILLGAAIWPLLPLGRVHAVHEYLITKYYRFENITEGGISQHFVPEYNHLDSIELFLANIYPETNGKIEILLLDENDKKVFQKKYKASSIPAGEYKKYKIGKKLSPGERYELRISYDGTTEEKPQIMVSERWKNLSETEEMVVNGEISEYNLAITYHYSRKRWFDLGE